MSYSEKDPLWYKEKSKYKNTACSANGHCGPVCVCKRIVRGYKATKSFNEDHKEVRKISQRIASKNSSAPDYIKHTAKSWVRNDDYNKASERSEKKWEAAQFGVSDVVVPAIGGSFGPEGLLIGAGLVGAKYAAKSVANAYNRGKLLDESMLNDQNY